MQHTPLAAIHHSSFITHNYMNKIIPAVALLFLTLAACKNDKSQQNASAANTNANVTALAGHWIAIDFCSRAKQYGSMLQAVNNAHLPFAYALSFTPAKPDSVEYFNGYQSKMLPVVYKADTLEIKGARGSQSVHLIYSSNGDKSISMFDPQASGVQIDKFIKSKAGTRDGRGAFLVALHHNLFSGNFQLIGGKPGPAIMFTPGGFITNFKDYDRYTVCTGGDCLVAGNEIDVVTLSDSKKEKSDKIFGFRYSNHNDTLSVVTLSNDKPDQKSAYQIGKPVYKFLRTKAE
jgi:hypothetical protein